MAPIKRTTKNNDEIKDIAVKLSDFILTRLEKDSNGISECKIEVYSVGHGGRPFGQHLAGAYIDFRISVGRNMEFDGLGLRDAASVGNLVARLMKEHDVEVKKEGVYVGYGNFTPDFEFPVIFRKFCTPCRSFLKLSEIFKRSGAGELPFKEWYSVNTSGKRGTYSESGERRYYCYDEQLCANILAWLKQKKTSRDTVEFKIVHNEDTEDRNYSMYYETECYGSVDNNLEITIKTQTGRVKAQEIF